MEASRSRGVKSTAFFPLLVLGVSLASGCSKTAMDTARPEPPQATAKEIAVPPPTVTHVYLDPGVAALCNVGSSQSHYESDSSLPADSRLETMRALVECLTSGPLQGRRLDLVGYTDPRGQPEPGISRVESVREALSAHGAPPDVLLTRVEVEPRAEPADANDWSFGRRVEILLAPRHGG